MEKEEFGNHNKSVEDSSCNVSYTRGVQVRSTSIQRAAVQARSHPRRTGAMEADLETIKVLSNGRLRRREKK